MPSNNGLKVCTFNAKYDHVDYNCCARKTCDKNCGPNEIPDSLLAALIAIQILPSKADIYNIQNVKNKCVVEHLLKEIARVKDIMENFNACDSCTVPAAVPTVCDSSFTSRDAHFLNIACRLNEFPGLCDDAVSVKDALACCGLCGMDYVDVKLPKKGKGNGSCSNQSDSVESEVLKYARTEEYNAYYSGSCLTLVKKSLCIVPETHEIPCVDSLVLFFEYNGQRFINVNVNLGCLINSFEEVGCRKSKVDNILCFLKKYEDCGAVIMTGAFGDIDYDTPQLFFRGDAQIPELIQKILADDVKESPVPNDFPCDLCNPVYELMELLMKNCKSEHIPYAMLLQYIRLQNCKKCNLYKLVPKEKKRCASGCKKDCCKPKDSLRDCRKSSSDSAHQLGYAGVNRAQLRQMKHRGDRQQSHHDDRHDTKHEDSKKGGCCGSNKDHKDHKDDKCNKPACVSAKKCCCKPTCEVVCKDNCPIEYKRCHCDDSKCEIKCKEPFVCKCDDSKHKVRVDTCKDLCKKGKSCCGSCAKGGHCEGDENVCDDKCDSFKYCDPITVLKRELCLYNTLNNIPHTIDRFTGFYDHFNRCLDCKYPRGMFQAWAQCQDYERPCKKSRVIDNNSELMALDHFLVSDCLKNNISYACLSDICITKCDIDMKDLIADRKHNALIENPYDGLLPGEARMEKMVRKDGQYVPQYAGSVVKSFFTHRMFCVEFDFPHMAKGCKVECDETLHGLGLPGLWAVLCSIGSDSVSIKTFEKFGLDKHPYFRDFFWNCLKRHECFSGESDRAANVLLKHASCDDNSVICIQKRREIHEDEFYKHLLCVLSNSDTRDRFIVNIAVMECLYKLDKMRSVMKIDCDAIYDANAVYDLFKVLSMCFKERINVASFIESVSNQNIACLIAGEIRDISKLVSALAPCLISNCIFMEVMLRHTTRALQTLAGTTCGNVSLDVTQLAGIDVSSILEKIRCGYDPKRYIIELIEEFGADALILMLIVISGISLESFPGEQ